ncbi:MAG: hypothetical protein LBQ56_01960, partial [Synergistaceae bacterium]|nr:hypothetical protein [Synergistaceae bacterium]
MKRVALDFDGVVHDYSGGWQGFESIPGGLCPGIAEGIRALNAAGYKVAIISSRARDAKGYKAIVAWLYAHGIDADEEIEMITCEKEPAMAYIDDR